VFRLPPGHGLPQAHGKSYVVMRDSVESHRVTSCRATKRARPYV